MARDGSEDETRGLNALGNPEVITRNGTDRGPSGEGRIGNVLPGGILSRDTTNKLRGGMALARGDEKLRSSSRK